MKPYHHSRGAIHRPSYEGDPYHELEPGKMDVCCFNINNRIWIHKKNNIGDVNDIRHGCMDFCHIESSSVVITSTNKVIVVVTTMSMFGNTSTSKLVPMSRTTGTGTPGTTSFCFSFSLPVSTQLTSRKLAGIDCTAIGKIESSSGYHGVAGPKASKISMWESIMLKPPVESTELL